MSGKLFQPDKDFRVGSLTDELVGAVLSLCGKDDTRNMILKMDERLSAMLLENGYTMKVIPSRNRKGKKKTEVRIFANNQRT